ncbi:MAG: hypothetical protein NTNFB02_34010 [Nitrospira sp.]
MESLSVRSARDIVIRVSVAWCIFIGLSSPAEAAPTVLLKQPVHFIGSDADVVADAGTYQVEAADSRLTLTAEGRESLLVEAQTTTHSETIDAPFAVTLPGEDQDVVHLVLLQPNGQALDAAGSLSGTRPRGAKMALATASQIHAAVLQVPIVGGYRPPSDFDLAFHHAPIHYQDTDSSNYRADYITNFDYDRNMIATDNWEHLAAFPLAAHAYYSVVETCTHWYIVYGFFHPRDWTDSAADQEHENDMEGLLLIVRKDRTPYGKLEGMITVYHLDFFSFTPPGSPLQNGHENIDGTITMQQYEGVWRPLTVQQAKGHGLKAFPYTSDFHGKANEDGIIYFPSRTRAEIPTSGNDRHVDYMLLEFFGPGGLWPRQLDEAPLSRSQAATFAKWGAIKGDGGGGCGSGITVTCSTDSPHPPWGWDDQNDGASYVGEMALDPAHLTAHYFSGLGAFSMTYLRNRYASDLKARGYRHGSVPRGWSKEMKNNLGQTIVLDDRTERVNLDELYSRLTSTCP